jgi:serine/threonine protein kinase
MNHIVGSRWKEFMTTTQDLSGKRLGDYVLLRKFASGGMAHIYLGEDSNLKRKAAIKVLSPDMAGSDDVLKDRFEREARAIANLHHPHIVPIYQFQKVDNLYFIAMLYVEGNDLADEIKKYRDRNELMPPKRWLPILKQVASALDHAHLRGIVHRDVKPSNILLDDGDEAYLSDFGLVLWEEVDKTLGTAFGTPRYISPEQATDSQSAVPQSDIYSLAVIVYELVTGKVMFKGKTPMEVALSHITEQPTPPRAHNPDVPANAQNEIMKALQKDATKRHNTALEFISKLEQAFDIEATMASADDEDDYEAPSTMAVRPEALEEISESSRELLDSWDEAPVPDTPKPTKPPEKPAKTGKTTPPKAAKETAKPAKAATKPPQAVKEPVKPTQAAASAQVAVKETPKPAPEIAVKAPDTQKRGLPLPLIGGAVAVILGLVVVFGLLNGGGGGGGSANMLLHYNDNFFAVVNTSEDQRLLLNDMQINGRSGETTGGGYREPLEPGACVFVMRSGSVASDIPDGWGCSGNAKATLGSSGLYWRADADQDTEFAVAVGNGRSIATCDTWGQAVSRTGNLECRVAWPNTETIETEE